MAQFAVGDRVIVTKDALKGKQGNIIEHMDNEYYYLSIEIAKGNRKRVVHQGSKLALAE